MPYAFNDDKSKFDLYETLDNVDNIAGSLATIEVSPAITNHGTGEYIMYDNTLFQVTSPIAAGENLVLGTNVSPINIGDQLKQLKTVDTLCSFGVYKAGATITLSRPMHDFAYLDVVTGSSDTKSGMSHTILPMFAMSADNNTKFEVSHTINGSLNTLYIQLLTETSIHIAEAAGSNPMIRVIYGVGHHVEYTPLS